MSEVITEEAVKTGIIEVLKTVFDPEIPVNIYDLGLIYEINVFPDFNVEIVMTLTSPSCPVAGTLPGDVEQKVKAVAGVRDVTMELVFEPHLEPGNDERRSEAGTWIFIKK